MKLFFVAISAIVVLLVECRELRSDNFPTEELKPSPFPSSTAKGLSSQSFTSGTSSYPTMSKPPTCASHQPSSAVSKMSPTLRLASPTKTLRSPLEASEDATNVQPMVSIAPTVLVAQSTTPTYNPSPLGSSISLSMDQIGQREDTGISETNNSSWSPYSIAIFVAVGSTFLVFISLVACGGGVEINEEQSTGTICLTICSSTDDETIYQCSSPPSPSRCNSNTRIEDVVEADYDEYVTCRCDEMSENQPTNEDVVEAGYDEYSSCEFASAQLRSLSRSLTPVLEETSVDFGHDEMSEFSV